MSEPIIEFKNVTKKYKLYSGNRQRLAAIFSSRVKVKTKEAIKGVSFTVNRGESVALLGKNGAGKSTILKMITEVCFPTEGEIIVNGRVSALLELTAGFDPELTGRENGYLNGALLGFSNAEMDEMYDDIWKFAELEQFQDQKLKNYSSGMQVRLAFSIAIRARGDILLLDEVLAVGDAAFQKKCNDYFKSLHENKQTVILVTHSMENVREFCDRAILIEQGKITMDGDPNEVADAYTEMLGIKK